MYVLIELICNILHLKIIYNITNRIIFIFIFIMYKNIPIIFKNIGKTSRMKKNISDIRLSRTKEKFIKDKLDHMLSPETKEYLKLRNEIEKNNK